MSAYKEIRALTGLRGIAALYVVFFHYTYWLPGTNLVHTLIGHGYLAVDLFFILSGFVMALNYRHLFDGPPLWRAYTVFIGRRIARIYPLYICGTITAYFLYADSILDAAHKHQVFALNLAMVQAWVLAPNLNLPAWSLSAEWAAYLIFPAMLSTVFFKRGLRHWLGLFCCAVTLVAFAWLPHILHHATFSFSNSFFDRDTNQVLRCLPEFALGILVVRFLGSPMERYFVSRSWMVTLLSLLLVVLLFLPGVELLFVILLPVFVLSLMQTQSLPARLLSCRPVYFLGLISYSVYIVHGLFIRTMLRLHAWTEFHQIPHAQSYPAALCFTIVFSLVVVLPISVFTYQYIELPGSRLLRRWFEGTPPVQSKPSFSSGGPAPNAETNDATAIPQAIAFPQNSG